VESDHVDVSVERGPLEAVAVAVHSDLREVRQHVWVGCIVGRSRKLVRYAG